MKEEIKNLRVQIDGLAQLTKELKPIEKGRKYQRVSLPINLKKINSNEINKAYDSLILAKAWLGKVLQELGESTPYANDGNRKTIEDIEPAADRHTQMVPTSNAEDAKIPFFWEDVNKMYDFKDKSHIEKVDWLREEIAKIISRFKETYKASFDNPFLPNLRFSGNIEQHLSEARFWLGFELGRIRDGK
jgi:hypothetical protein